MNEVGMEKEENTFVFGYTGSAIQPESQNVY